MTIPETVSVKFMLRFSDGKSEKLLSRLPFINTVMPVQVKK